MIKRKEIYIFGKKDQNEYRQPPGIALVPQDERVAYSFYNFMRKNEQEAQMVGIQRAAKITLGKITPALESHFRAWSDNRESILYDSSQFALLPHDWKNLGVAGMTEFSRRTLFDQLFWEKFWMEYKPAIQNQK